MSRSVSVYVSVDLSEICDRDLLEEIKVRKLHVEDGADDPEAMRREAEQLYYAMRGRVSVNGEEFQKLFRLICDIVGRAA